MKTRLFIYREPKKKSETILRPVTRFRCILIHQIISFPNHKRFLVKLGVIFFALFQIVSLNTQAQQNPGKEESELAIGVKIVTRQVRYGHSNLYITDPNSISIQPVIRYDSPVKTSGSHFIDLVGQAGFLFCKAKVFDTAYTDPITNKYIYEHSHNPAYMPLSLGIYNMSGLSVGAEVFYWKGLGVRDIWGVKFLSLGYKGRQFRINACGEWYAQAKNLQHSGLLISVDILVKLIKGRGLISTYF